MPREPGRLYCAVVRESGSGQYTVVGVNEIDMNLRSTGVWVSRLAIFFKIFFFHKNFVGHMSICGATDTAALDFW